MADKWVSYLGNDSTGTGTPGNPYRTLRKVLGLGAGSIAPAYGDTIYVVPHPDDDPDAYYAAVAPTNDEGPPVFYPNGITGIGASDNRLVIRSAETNQKVILRCDPRSGDNDNGSACFGVDNNEWVTWDGFATVPLASRMGLNCVVNGSSNCRIWNCDVELGARQTNGSTGNYECYFVNDSDHIDFYNIRGSNATNLDGSLNAQCGGFLHFRSQDLTVRNFEFSHVGTGIDDKEGGERNTYQKGYMHDIGVNAILINQLGLDTGNILDLLFEQILIVGTAATIASGGAGVKINLSASDETFDGCVIRNCTFYNVPLGITGPSGGSCAMQAIEFYNNILVCIDGGPGVTDMWQTWVSTRPTDLMSDYNTYRALTGFSSRFNAGTGETNVDLTRWRELSSSTCDGGVLDPQANTTDPEFQGSTLVAGDPSTNWRLGVGNALRTNGKTNGHTTGNNCARGCFLTDGDSIGLVSSSLPSGTDRIVLGVRL